jgi:dihydrolipoamide dehydrogenase
MKPEIQTEVAIVGMGTAGMHALREVRRAQRDFRVIDRGPLGSTCARVGCMPSKAALHVGAEWAARKQLAALGAQNVGHLSIDLQAAWARVRALRDRLAGATAKQARDAAGERLIEGQARFIEPALIEIETAGQTQRVRARSVILATGSHPVLPNWLAPVLDRTVTTDTLFDLNALPRSIGILGLGAIGLEMGLALARLGIDVVGAELSDRVGGIADPQVADRARERFGREIKLWLCAKARVERTPAGVRLIAGERQAEVALLLAALGRKPNTRELGLKEAGFPLDERGAPRFDPRTMQVGDLPVFIAGDASGGKLLLHEAADQGAIAGYNACAVGKPARFAPKSAVTIAFTAPDVASVGAAFDEFDPDHVVIGSAEGSDNGRAIILGKTDGHLRIYADSRTGRLLGAAMVAIQGEHLAQLLAWAIQRRETASDLLASVFYHPTMEEMLQTALQDIARQMNASAGAPLGLQLLPDADRVSPSRDFDECS